MNDENVTAEVVGKKTILFEGEETILSRSALSLLRRDGYTWKTAQGSRYWMFNDETIAERFKRLRREADDAEAGDDDYLAAVVGDEFGFLVGPEWLMRGKALSGLWLSACAVMAVSIS